MKILVGIKRVIDYNVRVQINRDGTDVVKEGVKMSINPFDEIAVEQALRLREAGVAEEVVVVSIGPGAAQQQLRTALAMGADRATLVETEAEVQPLAAARALLKLVESEDPGMVLLGKQAIDDDANQVGQMLAAMWDKPQATFISGLEVSGDTARAVHYLTIAGDAAAAVYAGDEAVTYYRRALELLRSAHDEADAPVDFDQQVQLYTRLGRVLELSARHDAAIAVYNERPGHEPGRFFVGP